MSIAKKIAAGLAALVALGAIAFGIYAVTDRDADEGREEVASARNGAAVQREAGEREAGARESGEADERNEGSERSAAAAAAAKTWSFDQDKTGAIAGGWTNVTGTWQVVADPTAPSGGNVLAQVSNNHAGGYFNVAVANAPEYQDVAISVRSKAVAGNEDQGGGPVWRLKDIENYYIARQNNLEDNYRVYKVVDGRRMELGSADLKAPTGTWHELTATMVGSHIQCFFDGKKYLDVTDDTFKDAGKVGLWTKADAQTHFDEFRVSGKWRE